MTLAPTLDDMRRAQAIVGSYTRTRLEVIAARSGNPMGAEVRSFEGGALALRAPGFRVHRSSTALTASRTRWSTRFRA